MVKSQNIILVVVVLGTLMGALDSTIVLLAFPAITDGLHSDFITTIWIILTYLLVIAVTTTQLGRIGDIYGRTTMFNAGFAVFTVGSALCGFSPNIYFLIGSRVVQALGGALMQSNSGAIIADTFPPNARGKAYGFSSLGWTIGSMLGIVLGGIVTTFVGWQFIFFINIPIGAIALILGFKYLKQAPKVKAKLDIVGMVLLAASLLLISYGATSFASQGMTIPNVTLLLLGAFLVPLFIAYENRFETPMVDFTAFKDKVLRNSCLATFFVSVGYISVVFLIIMYLQGVRGLSPLNASLLLIPGYVIGSLFQPGNGQALRQNRCSNYSHNRHRLPCCSNSNLHSNQPKLIPLHHYNSIRSVRIRHSHVFPRQQLRRYGKSPTRQLRQHLWPVKNTAERWHLRKLRSRNIRCLRLYSPTISLSSIHQHHKTLRRLKLIFHRRHTSCTLRFHRHLSGSRDSVCNPRKRKPETTTQLTHFALSILRCRK